MKMPNIMVGLRNVKRAYALMRLRHSIRKLEAWKLLPNKQKAMIASVSHNAACVGYNAIKFDWMKPMKTKKLESMSAMGKQELRNKINNAESNEFKA